ncbi:MAG: glycosyltransferase family 2 protein [Desulfovibrionaceae bacterium]|nr:glycosyltransferase family 2 protein [Desulfovibrionaceae bacterium]MBF0514100.1 glycosyltransferase family 2 protein [Desulfovibrionaceae bacterium]
MAKLSLSVVMPALNEEKDIASAIKDTLEAMDAFHIEGEVIVVNDGSTDRTGEIVAGIMAAEKRVRTIVHDRPHGIGGAFWAGVDQAAMDTVIMLPGDNENDPQEIFRYLDLMEHVDIVIPFLYNRGVRSFFRNVVSYLYRLIINVTFLVNFNYTNGTILYRRNILTSLDIRSMSFFFQTDILIRAIKRGYLFAEVPYKIRRREGGGSKAISYPSLLRVMKGYLKLVRDIYFAKAKPGAAWPEDCLTGKRRGAAGCQEHKEKP